MDTDSRFHRIAGALYGDNRETLEITMLKIPGMKTAPSTMYSIAVLVKTLFRHITLV